MHEVIRHRFLKWAGRTVTARPGLLLIVCVAAAAGSIALTAQRLTFLSDRSALVSTELDWNRRYLQFKDDFPRWGDVIVALAGDPADERVDELAREVAAALHELPETLAADAGFLAGEAGPRMFRTADEATFAQRLEELAAGRHLATCTNPNQALAVAAAGLQQADGADGPDRGTGEDPIGGLEDLLAPYLDAVAGDQPSFDWIDPAASADARRWEPLRSESGRLRFVLVQLNVDETAGVDSISRGLVAVRTRLAGLAGASDIGGLEWGVTGIPAIESDETAQSIHDSTVASVLAVGLITLLMVFVFRGLVLPVVAAVSLLLGIAWSFGWLILTVGHLQLLSVVFTVILLGLGIDFALHLVARLELIREEETTLPAAMSRVFAGVGPGLITGAFTTAAAFAVIALTDFKGMAEMGIIAAGGIILCLLAMCTAFPAALGVLGWKRLIRHRRGGEEAHFGWARLDWVDPHPVAVLVACSIVMLALALAGTRVRYDPNVLNLQPPGIESVRWEHRIMEDGTASIWAALVRTTPERAGAMADRLRAVPLVSSVGGMGLLVPPDRADRDAQVAEVRATPVAAPTAEPGLDALQGQLALIRFGLAARLSSVGGDDRARVQRLVDRLAEAVRTLGGLDSATKRQRWRRLDQAFAPARERLAQTTVSALAAEPPSAGDLPAILRDQWVGRDGSWLLRVNPVLDDADRSILDPQRLGEFVSALRSVEPAVFGPPVQIHESSRLIVREYIKAACYALATIIIVLLLDFRSLADALSALLPVTIGFVGAFGIMGLTGTPLNFANIIVLPIIFGIGAAAGVHVVHRWRADPTGRPSGLSGGTGRAVTLTMLTTMIGFGCMVIAEHRGIRSLGLVMLAGLGVTLLACYTALPALLQFRRPGHPELEDS
jgi:hopanoid biosynthesis associated RND transporter like protein HpnN